MAAVKAWMDMLTQSVKSEYVVYQFERNTTAPEGAAESGTRKCISTLLTTDPYFQNSLNKVKWLLAASIAAALKSKVTTFWAYECAPSGEISRSRTHPVYSPLVQIALICVCFSHVF